MKKFLTILIACVLFLPFAFTKVDAKIMFATGFNSEVNYIEVYDIGENIVKSNLTDIPTYYPFTPVNGDLCVFANGTTTGTYNCLQYNNSWDNSTTVVKTLAELITANKSGTHIAIIGSVYHKHGLDTADTSDDVTYDKILTSAGGNLDTGNYYLIEDITLENDIEVGANIYVNIDLCGHVININNHQIINDGKLTIESCKDTSHKFKTNSNGTYTWNETSGDTTFKGGTITGEFTLNEGRYYAILNNALLNLNNINIIGVKAELDSSRESVSNCCDMVGSLSYSALYLNNVNAMGNEGAKSMAHTSVVYCEYTNEVVIKDFTGKNNVTNYSGAVLCFVHNSAILDNVLITNNTCLVGGVGLRDVELELRNKIVVEENHSPTGADCNVTLQDPYLIMLNNDYPLQVGSNVGLSYVGTLPVGGKADVVDIENYSNPYKPYFTSDSDLYFLGYSTKYISINHRIDEQPTSSNGYKFVLNETGKSGYNVSYQWINCSTEEIAPKTGNTQNYISAKFMFHNILTIDSTFDDGYWKPGKDAYYGGVTLSLKAGDIVCIESSNNSEKYLVKAPQYLADVNFYSDNKVAYFTIQEDGVYGAVSSAAIKVYVLHSGNKVIGQTTNTLTISDSGVYVCKAVLTKNGQPSLNMTSDVVSFAGLKVNFIVPDSTIYVPTINYIKNGSTIARPEDPSSIKVIGWYKEPELTNEWDFANDVVTEDITLYAKYELDIDISVKMILVNQAQADCIVTVGEGLQLTLDNFYSFTLNGTTYLKSELDLIDPLDETKGYTNGTFTVEEGCIKITLPQNYINTFGLGTYDVSVQLTGMLNSESVEGMVLSDTIYVVDKIPGTGVETNNSLFEIVALTSIACAACYIVLQKKHN